MTHPHYWKKFTLACYLINLPKSHEFYYSKARMSSLMLLNSGFYKPKTPVEKNLDAYELMVKESLLI